MPPTVTEDKMIRIKRLNSETKKDLLQTLLKRSTNDFGDIEKTVDEIIQNVRRSGDRAIFDYALKFDGCRLDESSFMVDESEIEEGAKLIDSALYQVMGRAASNIRDYHM